MAKIYEMSNHWVGQSLVKGPQGPLDLQVSTAALPSYNQTSRQFLALSLILLRFLARYRPGLQDRGTVNGTQTGISGTILYILIQNLRKNDISSSLSCNPATGRLNSALSPTW